MTKREEREIFFKSVFMTEFLNSDEDYKELISNYLETEHKEEYSQRLTDRMDEISSHISEIDDTINAIADGWKTSRMAKVDLALLRVAIYEMVYEKLEKGIAINEAVELAKQYGEDSSYKFINGILAKVGE